jgi:hypothetical protein
MTIVRAQGDFAGKKRVRRIELPFRFPPELLGLDDALGGAELQPDWVVRLLEDARERAQLDQPG